MKENTETINATAKTYINIIKITVFEILLKFF